MNQKQVKLLLISLSAILIKVFGFLLYAPYLLVQFINEDFLDILWQNPKNLFECFRSFIVPYGVYWRPVTQSINALTYYFYGFNPFFFHLENIIFHKGGAFILFYFVYLISNKNKIFAYASALIFITLPGHLISVAWLPGRTDLLLTFFLISSLILLYYGYLQNKRVYYFLSALSFLFAIWSKELAYAGAVLPLLFIILNNERKWVNISIKSVIAGLLIIVSSLLVRKLLFAGSPFNSVNFADFTIFDMLKNFCIYPALLFFPPEYLESLVFKLKAGNLEPVFLAVLIIVFIGLIILNFIKSKPENKKIFIIGIAFYLIMILPALTEMNRWNSYAASAGITIALSALIEFRKKWNNIAYNSIVLVIILASSVYIHLESYKWIDASRKCTEILKTVQPLEIAKFKAVRIWGLPDKYNRINLMKSGNGEAFHYAAKSETFDTDAPVRCEINSSSVFTIANLSDFEKIIKLSDGRFIPWKAQSRSILINEEFGGKFSGLDYKINNRWINGKYISELRLSKIHSSRDTLDIWFTGGAFKKY